MDKFDELLKKLQDLNLDQRDELFEDLPRDIREGMFQDKKPVEKGLDIDKHRWYETSIGVYEFDGRYLGVRSVTNIWGNSDVEDIGHQYYFFEMKQVMEPTYKRI